MHSADENDSVIEGLLSEIQRVFRGAAVIAAHHITKQSDNAPSLQPDMRVSSDGARGSSAVKAHADVILLQERTNDETGNEVVRLGAFLKDGPDVDPIPLMESDHQSFYWKPVRSVPGRIQISYNALVNAIGPFRGKSNAVLNSLAEQRSHCLQHTGIL